MSISSYTGVKPFFRACLWAASVQACGAERERLSVHDAGVGDVYITDQQDVSAEAPPSNLLVSYDENRGSVYPGSWVRILYSLPSEMPKVTASLVAPSGQRITASELLANGFSFRVPCEITPGRSYSYGVRLLFENGVASERMVSVPISALASGSNSVHRNMTACSGIDTATATTIEVSPLSEDFLGITFDGGNNLFRGTSFYILSGPVVFTHARITDGSIVTSGPRPISLIGLSLVTRRAALESMGTRGATITLEDVDVTSEGSLPLSEDAGVRPDAAYLAFARLDEVTLNRVTVTASPYSVGIRLWDVRLAALNQVTIASGLMDGMRIFGDTLVRYESGGVDFHAGCGLNVNTNSRPSVRLGREVRITSNGTNICPDNTWVQ